MGRWTWNRKPFLSHHGYRLINKKCSQYIAATAFVSLKAQTHSSIASGLQTRTSLLAEPIFRRGKALFSRVHSSALCLHVLDQISRGGLFPQSGISAALAVSGVLWLAPWFPLSSVPGQCLCLAPVCCRTSCSTCGCSFNHRNQAVVRMIPTTICGQLLLQCCCSVLIVKGKLPTP